MPRQILLVDDSATIARMVQNTFAHEDYTITVAKSGDEALARTRSAKPDVVLVDAGLPGKSGYDVCADLRSAGLRDTPVLILTNNFVPFDDARGQSAAADGFVVKPFETQGLIDKVSQAITARASGAKPAPAPATVSQPPAAAVRPAPVASPPPAAQPAPPARPAIATPQVAQPTVSAPISTPRPAPTPAPAAPARPVSSPPPQAAAPPPAARVPDSVTNIPRPRATLMGLPTVGPDGLPVPLVPAAPAARPAAPVVAAPPVSAPPPVAAPPPAARPPVVAESSARTMQMEAPSFTRDRVETPRATRVEPPRAEAPRVEPPRVEPTRAAQTRPDIRIDRSTPSDFATTTSTMPGMSTRGAGDNGSAAPRASIPASAPRMPRPSLVPNAPSPEAMRQLVQAVAGAAQARMGQPLGAHPEFEAVARLSREVIEQIAWEVVPELAEIIIRAELDRLVRERGARS